MARPIRDGAQDFSKFREGNYFYVDKTNFIREWWSNDQHSNDISFILRPRRFGKTLMLSTVEQFFSTRYANRSDLFEGLINDWFANVESYSNFLKALIQNDLKYMNYFMNDVAFHCFSSFDTGSQPNRTEPERFYHGFVLGLLVDLRENYILTSNRESGFGRYDVMLEPRDKKKGDAFIIEFKVHDASDESDFKATVDAALTQIENKAYVQQLIERGIYKERIKKYGFCF